jgi:hypothetical protein
MSKEARDLFESISTEMVARYNQVEWGRMMSSPALVYRNKVFVFFYRDMMVFRLGKGFQPHKYGIKDFRFLNPFKDRPPMKGWFEIPSSEDKHWAELTELAYNAIKDTQK